MAKKVINNVKLGVFVFAGLFFLILLLYMIGSNRHLFGTTTVLRARFENVQGLMRGNNVRFVGIEVGTVKRVKILSDTLIEVEMYIEDKMMKFIHKNALVSIGSDGLMGNRLLNITPSREPAPLVKENDILYSEPGTDTDEMLRVLNRTNNDIASIANGLKQTVERINNSTVLWALLNDPSLPYNLRSSMINISEATVRANETVREIQNIISDINSGQGSLGTLIKDTLFAANLNLSSEKIRSAGGYADSLMMQLHAIAREIGNELDSGQGSLHTVLKHPELSNKLQQSLDQIEKGATSFNQSMDAVKHSFLLRGYFRRLEKKQKHELQPKPEIHQP